MFLTVVLPSHNPDLGRLRRVVTALQHQSLPAGAWEAVLIDNASVPPLRSVDFASFPLGNLRIVAEPLLGLTSARRRGFSEARGEYIVMVDDDNILAPGYLVEVARLFCENARLGSLGGKSIPEFEQDPAEWWREEFNGLIACRDLGTTPIVMADHIDPVTGLRNYPRCAPLGGGMALRRTAAQAWLNDPGALTLPDRQGNALSSGGDNDINLTLLRAGWDVGYFPSLSLTHLIPKGRIQRDYLARLNRGIARSWVHVLARHGANPWLRICPATVRLRQIKAWFTYGAWRSPARFILWQGTCGHFEGLASLP